jgi:dethiobiotin synthetase
VQALTARHDWLVVEGAGGLLVPAARGVSMADLAARLAHPLLVVARARLGTLNHAALTLEAARRRGLHIAGLVICHADGPLCAADAANLESLRSAPGAALLGEIPPLEPGQRPADDALDIDLLLDQAAHTDV